MNAIRHLPAHSLTTEHVGQRVTVRGLLKRYVPSMTAADGTVLAWTTTPVTETVTGGLTDFDTTIGYHKVRLFVGGQIVELHERATVTIGDLDVPGGA